ncbi:MAG: hypothetical protein NVV63_08260 [Opitutus sp.]|nr:hypothetical protein [Opitutus sp.]
MQPDRHAESSLRAQRDFAESTAEAGLMLVLVKKRMRHRAGAIHRLRETLREILELATERRRDFARAPRHDLHHVVHARQHLADVVVQFLADARTLLLGQVEADRVNLLLRRDRLQHAAQLHGAAALHAAEKPVPHPQGRAAGHGNPVFENWRHLRNVRRKKITHARHIPGPHMLEPRRSRTGPQRRKG